ncbi:cytochrome P450 4C1-like isoform X2 [Phymastichus coffea]|nr:cytochrome P450 4C1-like isoform X2 [Phymastichus coffea]
MILTWIGIEPVIILNTPKYMEIVLSSNTHITKSRIYDIMKPWLGNGLLTSTGDVWFKQRRLITPAFHFNILEEYAVVMRDKVAILIDCIESHLQKNKSLPVNIFELATRYTLDTICEAAMGMNINSQLEPNGEYVTALHNFSKLSTERYFRFWLKWNAVYYRTQDGKKYLQAMKVMHAFTEKVILQKHFERKNIQPSAINENDVDEFGTRKRKVFLDLLLDASEKTENPLTLEEIREEVDTFMFAGHDTTSAGISWALFALGNAPDVQKKVHKELKEVFGSGTEPATTKQLNQLKYLDRVIKEVLRLYPSAPLIGRKLDKDAVIDGYSIPKNTILNIHIYQLHRNPEVWDDPERFDPDRFLPENIHTKSPYAYVPFSAGPRNCIGQKFAMLELKTALTAILRKWHVSSVLKPSEIKMVLNFILRPHNETIELCFTPLEDSYE